MDSAPFEASAIERYASRAAWDAEAADLVARMVQRWELTVREALVGGEAGSALRVERVDGTTAVLKVGYPHVESIWEAVALEAWAPFSPAVLRQDSWTWALLLEDVVPGEPLTRAALPAMDAVAAGSELLAHLHAIEPPEGIPSLAGYVEHFGAIAAQQLPGWRATLDRLGAGSLVERAIDDLAPLASGSERVFLHGDYNPGNVLAASDGTWRVVDPSPLVGDPAFDPWPLVEQLGAPWQHQRPDDAILRSADRVSKLTGIDRHRMLRWASARAGLNVTWYLEDDDLELAAAEVAKLVVLERLR